LTKASLYLGSPWRYLLAALLAFLLTHEDSLAAAKKNAPSELSEKKSDLGELRQRLEQLKREVAAGESARSEVADQLREHEKMISDLQRELHQLTEERGRLQQALGQLGQQTRSAEGQLGSHQQQLQRLLQRQYINGTPDSMRLLLSGTNPNQLARDLTYLSIIAHSRQQVVAQTNVLLEQKRQLTEETQRQAAALASVEERQRLQQQKMLVERAERQKMLAGLSGRLVAQRREIETLRRDEQRLARLIDRLGKLIASQAKRKRQAAAAPQPAHKKGQAAPPSVSPPSRPSTPDNESDTDTEFADFAKLRGKLPAPASGSLATRFGTAQSGGGRSKGLFFRTAAGSPVHAVAEGQVVFADWLRGFGNLVVIDHGGNYLSVYGYNEAVLKEVGSRVQGGERIATAGNTGGRSETGLYFELRRQGEAIDPAPWLRR
jgi:murein hydrolase activator